ncbi:hypothetical protein [Accumulibacter sp.]|uniref:hypothetical protein n=1 Tax=Accumulibacter sp. TaxID=2053492 RepID=UPI00258D1FCC|nr:hypothetical protein [Accumulibacter sp.]
MELDKVPRPLGKIALAAGKSFPVSVCCSRQGYYLGTMSDEGPFSRESVEYWNSRTDAERALARGAWTQRREP